MKIITLVLLFGVTEYSIGANLFILESHRNDEENTNSPKFDKDAYDLVYTPDHQLKPKDIIHLFYADPSNTTVSFNGYNKFFRVGFANWSNEEIWIDLIKPLAQSIISSQNSIDLVIKAELTKDPSKFDECKARIKILKNPVGTTTPDLETTTLVVPNTTQSPVFDQKVYEADYTNDHTLEPKQVIHLYYANSSNTTVTFNGYNKFFKVEWRNEEINIDLVKQLPENITSSQRSIELGVKAQLKKYPSIFNECKVRIAILTKPVTHPPKQNTTTAFGETFETTQSTKKTTLHVQVDESTTITNGLKKVTPDTVPVVVNVIESTTYYSMTMTLFIVQYLLIFACFILFGFYVKLYLLKKVKSERKK